MHTFSQILRDHLRYRRQIFKLAKADLSKTYRGSALGWSWAIIKPSVTIFVYWFAFSIGLRAGKDVNGYPFFLWLIAGLVPWFYMGDMITGGTNCIRRYSYLVTKMKFPVSTIPTFVSLANMMMNILLLAIVIVIFCLFGYQLDIYMLQLPFYVVLSFIFFTLWGLFASFIGAISKDFVNLVKSFMTAILWLSGILWNPDTIKISWQKKIINLNPITYLVNGFRNCLVNKVWFWEQPKRLLYFVIITLVLFAAALWSYKKLRKTIADVL